MTSSLNSDFSCIFTRSKFLKTDISGSLIISLQDTFLEGTGASRERVNDKQLPLLIKAKRNHGLYTITTIIVIQKQRKCWYQNRVSTPQKGDKIKTCYTRVQRNRPSDPSRSESDLLLNEAHSYSILSEVKKHDRIRQEISKKM